MLLSVQQVADRLQVSPSCVYQLIDSGKLSHHRIGVARGTIRVSEDDLTTYLEDSRTESANEKLPEPRPKRAKLKHLKI